MSSIDDAESAYLKAQMKAIEADMFSLELEIKKEEDKLKIAKDSLTKKEKAYNHAKYLYTKHCNTDFKVKLCKHGDKCTNPKCTWGHPERDTQSNASAARTARPVPASTAPASTATARRPYIDAVAADSWDDSV